MLLQSLVSTFSLSIPLRVVTRGEMEFHVQNFSKQTEEGQDKLQALVGGDMWGDTMLGEDMEDEQFG